MRTGKKILLHVRPCGTDISALYVTTAFHSDYVPATSLHLITFLVKFSPLSLLQQNLIPPQTGSHQHSCSVCPPTSSYALQV